MARGEEVIREALERVHPQEKSDRKDDEPKSAKGKILAALERRHPTKPEKDYLSHQPKGTAIKKIRDALEQIHPSGLTDREEKTDGKEKA